MLQSVDGRDEITVEELMPMIDIIYFDNYVPHRAPGDDYPADETIEKSAEIVDGFKKELDAALKNAAEGRIYLFDAKEREQKMKEFEAQGKKFDHFIFGEEV